MVQEIEESSATRVKRRVRKMRTRVRYGRRELERVSKTATVGGLFLSFLVVGLTGFGGGLAVISQIRALTVRKRRWISEHDFAEAFALAQSLPGTSAGNAVTYIGFRLCGWHGALAGMGGFILPSMLMMVGLAILYRHFRQFPDTDRLFHGLNAAVVAIIIVTAFRIGRNTLQKKWQWVVAAFSFIAVTLFRATVIEVVLVTGLVGIYIESFAERRWKRWRRIRTAAARRRTRIQSRIAAQRRARGQAPERQGFVGGYLTRALADERLRRMPHADDERETKPQEQEDGNPSHSTLRSVGILAVAMPVLAKAALLASLAIVFLRMGAVTFGGGFVMIPLIEAEVVETHHWLTHQEFADATALGQITPGPVLITATFIGYRVAGTLGALAATISVFLPACLMTIAAGSSLRRFRTNKEVQSFLRGVTPGVVGLLVAAAWSIGHSGIHSWIGISMATAAIIVLLRFRISAFWLMFAAGVIRLVLGKFVG